VRHLLPVVAAATVWLGVTSAVAADGSVQVAVSPNRPLAASTLKVNAQGPFKQPTSGRVTSIRLGLQRGFNSSPKAVARPCSAARAENGSCPRESQIGGGSAVVTGEVNGISGQDTINFQLFLAVPERTGDIASVVIEGSDTVFHRSGHTRGRLLRPDGGGLALMFTLTASSAPERAKITLNRLTLKAGAARTVVVRRHGHRRRLKYSLLSNPQGCTGTWRGTVQVTFSSGPPYRRAVAVSCSAG
jgi:hypothetical protein